MTVSRAARRPASTSRRVIGRGRRAVPIAVLAAAAVTVAGCGSDDAATTNAAASTGSAPRPALADDVPARAAAFAEGSIRPGGDAGAAIKQLLGLVGATDRDGALVRRLGAGNDREGLLPAGVSFRKDVLPHLGDHAATFLLGGAPAKDGDRTAARSVDGAIVAEVRDAAALREAVGSAGRKVDVGGQEVRIQGERATWIGDDVAALGTEPAVRAVIAATADGADLAGNTRFTAALQQVRTTDPVGVAWVDLQQAPAINAAFAAIGEHVAGGGSGSKAGARALARRSKLLKDLPKGLREQAEKQLGAGALGRSSSRGLSLSSLRLPARDATAALALELRPGRFVVRSGGTAARSGTDPKVASDAVAALPAGSWAAFGGGASGLLAKGSVGATALDGIASLLGAKVPDGLLKALQGVEAVSGGVQGENLLAAGGAVVVRTDDDDAAKTLLDQLGSALGGIGGKSAGAAGFSTKPQKIPGTTSGLVVGLSGLPLQLAAGVQGDRLAIGLGADSVTKALADGDRFSGDPLYKRATTALDGLAPSLVLQPAPLTDLLSTLGPVLGGILNGGSGGGIADLLGGSAGGSGGGNGIAGLLGGAAGGSAPKAGGSKSDEGTSGLFGSAGLGRVVGALGRIKLVTAGRESTGASTWRGTLVVEFDAAKRSTGTSTTPTAPTPSAKP